MRASIRDSTLVITPDASCTNGQGFWPNEAIKSALSTDLLGCIVDLSDAPSANAGMLFWLNECSSFFSTRLEHLLIAAAPSNLGEYRSGNDDDASFLWTLVNTLEDALQHIVNLNETETTGTPQLVATKSHAGIYDSWHMLLITLNPSGIHSLQDHHLPSHIDGVICDLRYIDEFNSITIAWLAHIIDTCQDKLIRLVVLCNKEEHMHLLHIAAMDLICEVKPSLDEVNLSNCQV